MSAGIVKTTPPATDSPADPIVCTMLFSRMVEPPSFFSTEIASTAIGIEALTVRPARRPRYTVDAPNSRPNSDPMMTALSVNSAGDCEAGTYGLDARGSADPVVTGVAMAGSVVHLLLQFPWVCETAEQSSRSQQSPGLRADDEPVVGVPALPERARRRRRQDDFLAGAGRAVPSQRRADPQRP